MGVVLVGVMVVDDGAGASFNDAFMTSTTSANLSSHTLLHCLSKSSPLIGTLDLSGGSLGTSNTDAPDKGDVKSLSLLLLN